MFNYKNAFSRNIGWINKEEQEKISKAKIAIAGMGGVGGQYLVSLSRMGFQNFKIADFDIFEEHNFNRQYGATISTIDKEKSDVMSDIAKNINPNSIIKNYDQGITDKNIDDFLENIDIYIDGLDFFVLDVREKIFKKCKDLSIPAITVAPIGMGGSMLFFDNTSMSFNEYFNFPKKATLEEKLVYFISGLDPDSFHASYMIIKDGFDFKNQKVSSNIAGINMAASIVAANTFKVISNRGGIIKAPHSLHFDAFLNESKIVELKYGNKNYSQMNKIEDLKNKYNV